jgi:4-amino-4-deoxy-L-arabinose transferase-like glycosyltransferase
LALRIPSALAATLTVGAMYLFAARILQSKLIGFLSGLIILSAFGFSDIHIGRSGDYDALLTFFPFIQIAMTMPLHGVERLTETLVLHV